MKPTFAACALFAILPFLTAADAPRDLASTLQPLAAKYHLPGAVGAIIHGDKIVAIGSTGIRKTGDPAPFLPTDLIHLGSDTKAMTGLLIAQLIDKKQLRFEDTMADLFPDLAPGMNPEMAKNTVRNLLNHNAGFPHDLAWGSITGTHQTLTQQRRLAVEKALSVPPTTPIGKFSYSNISFVLLGAIIETKTGQSWEEVIAQEIFQPLHMSSAGFGPPNTHNQVDQPWGHILKDGNLIALQSDNVPVMAPAGEVHCSIADWSKFIAETLKGAQGHPTLVTADTFKQLTDPIPGQPYAGGWLVTTRPWAGGLTLTHTGSNTMWFCNVWIAPAKDFAVMFATNYGSDSADKAADEGVSLLIDLNKKLEP
jgi:CubicO group peptidase (beta-lactamase class C family)